MRRLLAGCLLALAAVAAHGADGPVLRYRFEPDQALNYVTNTTLEGSVTFTPDQRPAQQLPLTMTVADTVRYRVSVVKPDGSAWVAVELAELKIRGKMFDADMNLEMTDIGEMIMINLGPKSWVVERPGDGPAPLNEEIGLGFTTLDAAQLFVPVKMLLAPTGEVLEQDGLSWQEQLAKANPIGAWMPILRPFGDALPELPGRDVTAGQTWHQERQMALPMADQKFPILIDFGLAAAQPEAVGVPFEYTGRLDMADVAMTIEPMPGMAIPLKLQELQNRLQGTGSFDPTAGTLLAQELKSTIISKGRGEMEPGFSLDSNLMVTSQRKLDAAVPGA